ncbi:MAG: DegT/DnrJ/EryC1/StrS family aminotransferase [Planctomycetota bacterium]
MSATASLAIHGGPKTRTHPWPARSLIGAEERAAVLTLLDEAIASGRAPGYNGPAERAYCEAFAEGLGGGFADAVNSGTTALYCALRALELEPFTEVVVGPITDPGGMMPVPLMGCIPVVPDAEPGRYNTGPAQIAEVLSPLTSAIVVAHVGGEPVDMPAVVALARERGIPVVEDCAQAHLARLGGRSLGTFGDLAVFSTMFGKHHCTGSQGGLVFTRDERLYQRVRHAADRGKPFGLPEGATNCLASLNFNLDEIGCTIGLCQLRKLPDIVRRRREVVAKLTEAFAEVDSVVVPPQVPGAEPSWWFWRLDAAIEKLTCDKATFCAALRAEGIPLTADYRHMPHRQDWYRRRAVFGSSGLPWTSPLYKGDRDRAFPCPNALAATDRQFNLAVHEAWTDREIADTLAALRKVEAAYLA